MRVSLVVNSINGQPRVGGSGMEYGKRPSPGCYSISHSLRAETGTSPLAIASGVAGSLKLASPRLRLSVRGRTLRSTGTRGTCAPGERCRHAAWARRQCREHTNTACSDVGGGARARNERETRERCAH